MIIIQSCCINLWHQHVEAFKFRHLGYLGWGRGDLYSELSTSPPLQQGAEETSPLGLEQTQTHNKQKYIYKLQLLNKSFSQRDWRDFLSVLLSHVFSLSYQTSWPVCPCLWGCLEPSSERRCPYLTEPEKDTQRRRRVWTQGFADVTFCLLRFMLQSEQCQSKEKGRKRTLHRTVWMQHISFVTDSRNVKQTCGSLQLCLFWFCQGCCGVLNVSVKFDEQNNCM